MLSLQSHRSRETIKIQSAQFSNPHPTTKAVHNHATFGAGQGCFIVSKVTLIRRFAAPSPGGRRLIVPLSRPGEGGRRPGEGCLGQAQRRMKQPCGAGLPTPPTPFRGPAGPRVSRQGRGGPPVGEVARSGDLATTWQATFGAGLPTPPTPFRGPGRTAGLPPRSRWTSGRRGGYRLVRDP